MKDILEFFKVMWPILLVSLVGVYLFSDCMIKHNNKYEEEQPKHQYCDNKCRIMAKTHGFFANGSCVCDLTKAYYSFDKD